MKLAVQIRQADPVIIDQIQRADAGTGKGLHHAAAHTTDSKDSNTTGSKLLHRCLTI